MAYDTVFGNLADIMAGAHQVVFGDTVSYSLREALTEAWDVQAIFEADGVVVDTSGDIPVESRRPLLYIRKTDFTKAGYRLPKKGDMARISDTVYSVVEAAQTDDGQAEMCLVLMKKGNYEHA